ARGAAEAASCVGEHERCAALVAEGLAHADTLVEKAAFYVVAVGAKIMRPETLRDAVRLGLEALRVLGVDVPRDDLAHTAREEIDRFRTLLSESSPLATPPVRAEEGGLDHARLAVVLMTMQAAWHVGSEVLPSLVSAAALLYRQLGPGP